MLKIVLLIFFVLQANAFTILIDPGHGGDEDGAMANGIKEKDIALSISKLVYDKLKTRYSVYLTRSVDRTVTLQERAQLAEKLKADLFLSIHINSSPDVTGSGFETYYLDNHDNIAVKKVEKAENLGLGNGDDAIVQQILTDLVVQNTVVSSKALAASIHSEIKNKIPMKWSLKPRGVRAALFYVLALSKRPGVLLEVGFLSNEKDRKKMLSSKFQEDYAEAVAKGVVKHFQKRK